MRIRFALVALLALLASADAFAADRDLSGHYSGNGTAAGDSVYTADVTITAHGDTYLLHWKMSDAEYDGVGVRQGDTLAVGWTIKHKAAVVLYAINGRTLDGRWTDGTSSGKVYTETLKRRD